MLLYDRLDAPSKELIDILGPKMDASNVADYYFHHDKEYWCVNDFPRARPPFERMWVEYRYPSTFRSKEIGEVVSDAAKRGFEAFFGACVSKPPPSKEPGEWLISGNSFLARQGKIVEKCGPTRSFRFDLDRGGEISTFYIPIHAGNTADEKASYLFVFHPILLAFSLGNCKNIEIVEVSPDRKLQKARERRGKPRLSSYRIINVLPFGKTYRQTVRKVEGEARGLALHIRAGSFARYGPEFGRGKLFGKHEGMFWRPQSLVGNAEHGVSVHDYAAKAK